MRYGNDISKKVSKIYFRLNDFSEYDYFLEDGSIFLRLTKVIIDRKEYQVEKQETENKGRRFYVVYSDGRKFELYRVIQKKNVFFPGPTVSERYLMEQAVLEHSKRRHK